MASFLKSINLLNFTRTTTSASYTSTADREPIWLYTATDYDGVNSVMFSAVMRATSGDTSAMTLSTTGGTDVTGAEVTTTSTVNVNVLSGDILANLTNATEYKARWKRASGSGTSSFDGGTVLISQTDPTATVTIIELGEDNNVPSTSYSAPTDYGIFQYDSAMFDGTVAIYLEADLHGNANGDTTYGALYDITGTAQVTGSEVSHTGDTTTTRKRSGAITLTNGREYRPDIKGTSTSDDVPAVKLIIKQTGTITKTASYVPILNTVSSGTETSYTAQNRLFTFNNTDWSATTTKNFYYEATLKVSANTGYSQLYNVTDTAQISELSTASTTYARVRSTALTMPVDTANVLGNYRKIDTSGTVTHGRSFLIVELEEATVSTSIRDLIGGFIPFAR